MSKVRYIYEEDLARNKTFLATVSPASRESVNIVLNSTIGDDDGRSEWVWVRLANGDLVLGVFPHGDTYFAVEKDAQFPWEDGDG